MYDKELLISIFDQIFEAIEKIESRTKDAKSAVYFTSSVEGMEKLDGICMLFIAIGESLKNVDTLILGGKDRGIDYSPLFSFLPESGVSNLIFIGEAGKRIRNGIEKLPKNTNQRLFTINQFSEISELIRLHTRPGAICLLSPAAASYDQFKNFEERGEVFRKIAENI